MSTQPDGLDPIWSHPDGESISAHHLISTRRVGFSIRVRLGMGSFDRYKCFIDKRLAHGAIMDRSLLTISPDRECVVGNAAVFVMSQEWNRASSFGSWLKSPIYSDQEGLRPVDRAAALTAADLLTCEQLQTELIARLVQDKSLPVLLLDLTPIARVRRDRGESTYARILDLIGKEILRLRGDYLRTDDLIALSGADGQEILVFPTPREGGKHPRPEDLQAIGDRVEVALRERVLKLSSLNGYSRLSVGVSLGILNPLVDNKSTVRRAIEDARMNAHVNELCRQVENRRRLQYLILEKEINVHFQPIVNLDFGEIHGFEALSRGPRHSDIESPLSLFGLAEENDLVYELDHVCRWKAVESSGELGSHFKLFLNTLPLSVRDPHFKGKHLQDLFNESSIVPGQVVLEVTEQFAIEDYTRYLDEMRYYSDMGCLIAIDDVGSGYSGLEKLMNIRPNYLKMDMHIVRDIDRNTMKQKIMKAFCQMAEEMGATVVAEGIETTDELLCLRDLGVRYGQGYLLGKPKPEFQSRSIFDWGSLSSVSPA